MKLKIMVSLIMVILAAGGTAAVQNYMDRKSEQAYLEAAAAADQETEQEAFVEDPDGAAVFGNDLYGEYASAKKDWIRNKDGSVTYRGKKYRRNTYIKPVLIVGVDRSGLAEENDVAKNGQADAVFLAAEDTVRNRLRILMIPRDSVVPIRHPDGNFTYDHLSLSWAFGDGMKESAVTTRNAVSSLLMDLPVAHYIAMDMAVLSDITDTVGGVTVTVPNGELEKQYPSWKMGSQITLHGKDAERFLRYRDLGTTSSSVFRMQQHRAFIVGLSKAAKKKTKEESGFTERLYDTLDTHMVTDLKKGEFLSLCLEGLQSEDLAGEDITTLPGIAVPASEEYPWDRIFLNYEEAIPIILDLFYREALA